MTTDEATTLLPGDAHDDALLANVHPPDWVNPTPAGRYHLVVIGAGTAGLVAAAGAAGLGARVALVERRWMGGDCLVTGCVPSKALLRSARAAADVRAASGYGVRAPGPVEVHFPEVMERLRRLRAGISPHDSASRFRSLGVDVFLGPARFTGPDAVDVAGRSLRFGRAVIATGARPAVPDVPGLDGLGVLTSETVFGLTERPARLAILGAGPIGCELAQAFARLGSQVTLIDRGPRVLPRDDPEASALVAAALERDGVGLRLRSSVASARIEGADRILIIQSGSERHEIHADTVLVAAGRTPNVDGLGLESAGVEYGPAGVIVDDRLRTTNRRVFAAGDVASRFQFTHAADALARIAVKNALFLGRARASALTIPWCTYTDPEVAHVGITADEAAERGSEVRTFVQPFATVDRAVLDGESEGFVKVFASRRGRILGATAVGAEAGAVIAELTLAMTAGVGLGTVARTVHPYPTRSLAVKALGDAYNRTRLTPAVARLFRLWLRWTG